MSRWFMSVSVAVLILPAGPAKSQSTSFHGPVSGLVYSHASRGVRPLYGIPGALQTGPTVLDQIDSASIAPGGKWALVTRGDHSSLVRGLSDLAPAESPTDGLMNAVDRVQWNSDGSFALLYCSATNLLQRIRVSEAGAVADSPIDLSPWGQATTLTIDSAGRQIAFGIAGMGLYEFGPDSSPVLISSMVSPVAAVFDSTGRLYAVDADRQRIMAIDSGSSALEFASFFQADTAAVAAVGLAVSGNGRYLMLADRTAQAVRVYETASRILIETIPLDFPPTRFEGLLSGTFLLNGDNSNEWLLVLDARQAPRLSFVPANREPVQ